MKIINICTYRYASVSENERGYPATHALDLDDNGNGDGIPLCGQKMGDFFVNDHSGQSTNCRKCLRKLESQKALKE